MFNKGVSSMKQATINGIKVNYTPYGDAILLLEGIDELGISNGLIIPYSTIKNGMFIWHDCLVAYDLMTPNFDENEMLKRINAIRFDLLLELKSAKINIF